MSGTSILIIGAGPAGLSLARALSMRGFHGDVTERQAREAIAVPAADGREIARTRASLRILGELGILARIDPAQVSPLVRARDAAVGMHPVTAHGFNLGLASVEHLAATVSDSMARHGDPAHPALLARYQRRHRAGSATLFLGTGLVVRVFTDDRAPAQPLRRAIMQAARALPPLRRALADALLDEGPVDPTPLQRLRRGWDVLRPRVAPAPRLQ